MSLIAPYGGQLVDLMVPAEEREAVRAYAATLPSIQLAERAVCDLEMMATGGFSPLDRFMGEADYDHALETMRLASGPLFPIPVTLPVEPGGPVGLDRDVALRNARNELLAVMTVEEIYPWDPAAFGQHVCGTKDDRHPLIAEMRRWGRYNLSGRLRVFQLPVYHDFRALRMTPMQTRARLERLGRANVVAFQTRNPLHRAHEEMTQRAIQRVDGVLLLHPAVGMTEPGDVNHYVRVRTYSALVQRYYAPDRVLLALLPLAMRLAGPREALWHALIRRNYGANHLVVGRDHGSPGSEVPGQAFYEPDAAQRLVARHSKELGVGLIPFQEFVYLPDEDRYEEITRVPSGARVYALSGTRLREEYLNTGRPIPGWFVRPEVADILAETFPPRDRQGVCVWFTGLSGAGKSTTASVLTVLLQAHGRQATVLDGDVVRTHLSKGLGFSREDRDTNIRRIGFVASEIVRHGGIAVCAAVSPYRATRDEVRAMMEADRFIEVFVDTPLEVCERRDAKGMYAKARRGEITGFTGIDDPYEPPFHPEITLNTVERTAEENAWAILAYLMRKGFVENENRGVEEQGSKGA
jgi:sulfate adenylyltransferase